MTVLNRTVFDIPLTWNRTRFESARSKSRLARKLIESSINVQFERQMRGVFSHNIEIEENINEISERLCKYHDKLRVLDNMIELASQSLRTYFDRRMESIRAVVSEHCHVIQEIIYEEAEHWKEIHAIMDQNLINPGDIRSRNNYPRAVQKSPAANIETIEEENEEEYVSKLLNGKTLTPLLTQMIRKSRVRSKRLTIVPSIKLSAPLEEEFSVPRKAERYSMHILPLSISRQPLRIVDTTFVVKPEETIVEGDIPPDDDDNADDDEPNGTYRAHNPYYQSHLLVTHPGRLLIDSQPNIPTRLCFSPTMIQDTSELPGDDTHESSPSYREETSRGTIKTLLLQIDQNRTHVKHFIEDNRRFGQTFLLDIVKTEQEPKEQRYDYVRPTIPDDDVIVIDDTQQSTAPTECSLHSASNLQTSDPSSLKQSASTTAPETVPVKTRPRNATKTKTKSVIVSARKTRSAAKVIAEREAAAAVVKASVEKPPDHKRKTRKRKQSRSIDRLAPRSDEENGSRRSSSTHTSEASRKTKRRKKFRSESRRRDSSDDDDDKDASTTSKRRAQKRSKSKRRDDEQETSKRATKKSKDAVVGDNERDQTAATMRCKKTKTTTTTDSEDKKSKVKKRKPRSVKARKDDEVEPSSHRRTRSSARSNHRPN